MGAAESKIKTVNFPEGVLQQLRCSYCKGYLSCAPIRLLSDGRSVCGRCPSTDCDTEIFREKSLEAALSHVKFPCCYENYGCPSKLIFDHGVDHELRCVYSPFHCPSFHFTKCSWKGSITQVYDHFYLNHLHLINLKGIFQLDISEDKENILMVVDKSVPFLIRYKYEASASILRYDIRYFSPSTINASFKIQLFNFLDNENSINLKGDKCLPYSSNSPTFPIHSSLILNKFLAVLSNPTTIEVGIILSTKAKLISSGYLHAHSIINYELLDSLRCADCQNYLSLPIFENPQGSTICCDCNKNFPPSRNEKLHKLIMEANYPCRWNYCNAVCKGHSIRVHEYICSFRPYKCPAPKCRKTLTASLGPLLSYHLYASHHYFYFTKKTTYLSKSFRNSRSMVTIASNNEFVYIKHKKLKNTHTFKLLSLKCETSNVIADIYFEHSHCKLKSRRFTINHNQDLTIEPELFPQCFRNKKNVKIFIEVSS